MHSAVIVPSPVNFGLHCMVGETVNEISLWGHLNHSNRLCIDHRVSAFGKKKKKRKALSEEEVAHAVHFPLNGRFFGNLSD